MRSRRCRRSFRIGPASPTSCSTRAALKADQKKIVGFSLESLGAGDKVWGRRAATPAFMHTHRMDGQRVQGRRAEGRAGSRPSRCPAPMWVPQTWQLQLVGDPAFGAGTQTVDAAVGVSAAGRRVDSRRHADRAGRLRRTWHRRGSGGPRRRRARSPSSASVRSRRCSARASRASRAKLAEKLGAAGVINAIEGPGQRAVHRSALRVRQGAVLHDRRTGRVVPADGDRQGRQRRHARPAEDRACR